MLLKEVKLGESFLMDGLDMDCNKVKVECELVRTYPEFLVKSEGIKVVIHGNPRIYKIK